MKKIFTALIAIGLIGFVAGCSKSKNNSKKVTSKTSIEVKTNAGLRIPPPQMGNTVNDKK